VPPHEVVQWNWGDKPTVCSLEVEGRGDKGGQGSIQREKEKLTELVCLKEGLTLYDTKGEKSKKARPRM